MASLLDVRQQAVTGLVPPQTSEAVIRLAWPAVTASPPVATLGRTLIRSIIFAPLGWLLLAPFYFKKILPFLAKRYMLTNRRVMIQSGLGSKPAGEVALADIDDIRVVNEDKVFYRAGDIEIVSKGQVALTLRGVPEPESFRHAIRNACMAWVPGKAASWVKFIPAKPEK